MALNQTDPMLFGGGFYKLTAKLIKFNIPTHDRISFPALGGIGVFISGIVNPIMNSVRFLFWVSVYVFFLISLQYISTTPILT